MLITPTSLTRSILSWKDVSACRTKTFYAPAPALLLCLHRLSEIRAVELLEDLCDAMSDYTIITPTNSPDSSSSSSETDGSNAAEQQEQQQHPIWVKYRGEGSTHVDGSLRYAGED